MAGDKMLKGLLLAVGLICVVQCVKVEVELHVNELPTDAEHEIIDNVVQQLWQSYGHLYRPQHHEPAYEHVVAKKEKKDEQDFSKIPGTPGVDYPIYHEVPHTSFHCGHVPAVPGMYANVETGCQAYHVCHDGREGDQGSKFLCTNGTIFNQKEFTCDWWYNVDCNEAPSYYHLNADPEHNPYTPKKKEPEHGHDFVIHA